jgi:hypothetical protein
MEAVTQAQAETRAVHDVAVAIDEARQVEERVALVEGEEFILDRNGRIACGGDSPSRSKVQRNSPSNTEPGRL